MPTLKRWDIFCSVVDNYGDIGVAWRLARQLSDEYRLAVRLYVDDRARLAQIAPQGADGVEAGVEAGVEVRDWRGANAPFVVDRMEAQVQAPAAVVIEAFGCGLPPVYLDAMEAQATQPAWINLEYLSAETWVDEHHGLASPHPRRALTRHFFFPGFTPRTGGLLRERALLTRRNTFLADPRARVALSQSLGIASPERDALVVSLFCYANAALPALLATWAEGDTEIACVVPEGVADAGIDAWAGSTLARPGDVLRRGRLTLARARFLPQVDYDRLLWACDVNFVRGEDSFMRAQWAARPLVWHAYPQAEHAHLRKHDAFLARYSAALAPETAAAYADFARAWNDGKGRSGEGKDAATAARAWPAMQRALPALRAQASAWSWQLAQAPDLAARLVEFACKVL
jgi:uncharacterized repeat protein (TIGR03837 family)